MITPQTKVGYLMLAMAEFEGWYQPGHPVHHNGSRAYRNHNPGNLRSSPFQYASIDNFAVFKNDYIGWMAFYWDIMQKSKGQTRTGLGPNSTLRDFIFTWAPPSDNNHTENYLAFVLEKTGFPESLTLKELFD